MSVTVQDIVKTTLDELSSGYEEYQFLEGLKTRDIYLNDQISLETINRTVHNIYRWNKEDDKASLEGENRPEITLHITTEGGDVTAMFSLINALQSSKTKVIGKAYGLVASAGAYIFIACHERHIQKDATFLMHAGGISLTGEANAARQTMKHYEEYDKRVKTLVLERSNITPAMYTKRSKDEWYEHGDKCIELGLAEKLI